MLRQPAFLLLCMYRFFDGAINTLCLGPKTTSRVESARRRTFRFQLRGSQNMGCSSFLRLDPPKWLVFLMVSPLIPNQKQVPSKNVAGFRLFPFKYQPKGVRHLSSGFDEKGLRKRRTACTLWFWGGRLACQIGDLPYGGQLQGLLQRTTYSRVDFPSHPSTWNLTFGGSWNFPFKGPPCQFPHLIGVAQRAN